MLDMEALLRLGKDDGEHAQIDVWTTELVKTSGGYHVIAIRDNNRVLGIPLDNYNIVNSRELKIKRNGMLTAFKYENYGEGSEPINDKLKVGDYVYLGFTERYKSWPESFLKESSVLSRKLSGLGLKVKDLARVNLRD